MTRPRPTRSSSSPRCLRHERSPIRHGRAWPGHDACANIRCRSSRMSTNAPLIEVEKLGKSFTLHLRGGLVLPVVDGVGFAVHAGECVALGGPSGIGKSSILKAVFGNYAVDAGRIFIRDGETRV